MQGLVGVGRIRGMQVHGGAKVRGGMVGGVVVGQQNRGAEWARVEQVRARLPEDV